MALTTRASIAQLTKSDLQQVVISVGKARPLEYVGVLNEVDMTSNPYITQQMFGLGPMGVKSEGAPFTLEQIFMGGRETFTATPYGMALEFTKEAWRDDRYAALKEMVGEMATSWRHRKNVDAHAPLNDAFTGATYLGFDGIQLCSTAHTGDPDQITKANRPTPDVGFSMTGIQAAILSFEKIRTGRNMPRILTPGRFLLGPTNRFTARELLGSFGKPDTADMNVNPLINDDLAWTITHYFPASQDTQWFLMTKPSDHRIMFLVRDEVEFDAVDDWQTGNAVYTMYGRLSSGFDEYRGVYGSTG